MEAGYDGLPEAVREKNRSTKVRQESPLRGGCGQIRSSSSHAVALTGGPEMSVQVSTRRVNEIRVVDVSGRVTLGEGASVLRDALRAMANEGEKKVLLNLAGLVYLDSSGIGVLVGGFATMRNQGGQLKLLNLTGRVKDLLLVTKLYTVFEIYEDEAAAIESFGGVAVGAPAKA
jgi:anti-sigma B factor antagonist